MGIVKKGVAKAWNRQREAILKEAQASGATTLEVIESGSEATSASTVTSTLKSLFGGSMTADGIQIYRLQSGPLLHLYVQPYQGVTVLPGEHHARLASAPRTPAVLTKGVFGRKWNAGDDKSQAQLLGKAAPLKQATGKLKWEWPVGTAVIKLDWAVQVRPLVDGSSQVVMQAGRYGGFTSYKVGIAAFVALCQKLEAALAQGEGPSCEQPFRLAVQYSQLFDELIAAPPTAPTSALY